MVATHRNAESSMRASLRLSETQRVTCRPWTVGGAPGDTATPDKEHTPPGPVSGPWPQP